MSVIEALIIGLLQGITEFMPVSSSGHLVIAQHILRINEPGITLEVFVHFGSLFSVFYVFYRDIINLLRAFLRLPGRLIKRSETVSGPDNMLLMLFVATVVTGTIGLFFKGYFEALFDMPIVVSAMLVLTGLILIVASKIKIGTKADSNISTVDSIITGLFQSIAIIPGISRSGSTITGSLIRGLDKATAVRFSFLLSIPAILGATLLELREVLSAGLEMELLVSYLIAMISSALSGVFAIKIFIRVLQKNKLEYFSTYCIILGVLSVAYFLFIKGV